MRKVVKYILTSSLFFIIIWVVSTGIRVNWNFDDVNLDLFATIKRFENVYVEDWNNLITTLGDGFKGISFEDKSLYVQITDITSFFQNIGAWFNDIFAFLTGIFRTIGGIISTIALYVWHVLKLMAALFEFMFFPVIR